MNTNRWVITWGERSWSDEDVTAAHMVAVDDLLGGSSWTSASPWTGPKTLAAWVAVLLGTSTGDLEGAIAEVYAASGAQLVGALAERPVEDAVQPD